jgi:uncharacterized protein (TIGR00730 family)
MTTPITLSDTIDNEDLVELTDVVAPEELQANMVQGAYKIAHHDHSFLEHDDQRGIRLMLEYQKVETALVRRNIASTMVVFGGARILSPEQSEAALMSAKTPENRALAELRAKQVPWYEMAREFGKIVSERGGALGQVAGGPLQNVIATGGGPGLMEAANRGAHEVGAPSIGYNITLEFEQQPNLYSSPDLTFLFKYFGIRKLQMALRASGLAVMPGGLGTMDEVYEIANLISCEKMPVIPIVLFDRKFWEATCDFQYMLDQGLISKSAMDLFSYADSAEEGWQAMEDRWEVIKANQK